MRADLGSPADSVPQKCLNVPRIGALLQNVRGERVAKQAILLIMYFLLKNSDTFINVTKRFKKTDIAKRGKWTYRRNPDSQSEKIEKYLFNTPKFICTNFSKVRKI